MYGAFNTNPYGTGSYPTMQNRLDSLQQQYQQQYARPQNTMSALSGRIVTGLEEARASQIALDGTISYFPSPAEDKIYAKYIDMQGLPVFLTYELQRNVVPVQPQYVDNSMFATLQSRVEALEKALKGDVASEPTTNANANYAQQ